MHSAEHLYSALAHFRNGPISLESVKHMKTRPPKLSSFFLRPFRKHLLLPDSMTRAAVFLIVLISALTVGAAAQILNRADERFLEEQARKIVESARLAAGDSSGQYRNATSSDLHVPGGNMGYPAFWVRDAVMMLGGDLISASELEGWIRLISGTLRGPEAWQVGPGVIVPAYAVPDHINFDGKPTFYPGNYETGAKQGGEPWGKYPPLDDNFYFISAVYEDWRMTGSLELFRSALRTAFSREPLSAICEKAYRLPQSDPKTALVVAGDIGTENAKDWGFCDAESKSGMLLFPSVLKYTAAVQLARLFESAGETSKAKLYRKDSLRLKAAIAQAFFHPLPDDSEGWLHSATGICNQPDVWGSAFAVASGALDRATALKVSRALIRAYREKTAVRNGCVRQILTTDRINGGGWEQSLTKTGTYQNGGYWGTASGWYISAISALDTEAAREMAGDYIRFLKENLRPDGIAQAWEWFNPDTGEHNNPLYVATVALPYLSLLKAGLLRLRSVDHH